MKFNHKKCSNCKEKDLDCLLRPCNHVTICYECAKEEIRCPLCLKFIDMIDKFYMSSDT